MMSIVRNVIFPAARVAHRKVRTNIFFVRSKRETLELRVRDLQPGMTVPLPRERDAAIKSVSFMDGSNGQEPRLISISTEGRDKTAVAVWIEFDDHEPMIAHPNSIVPKAR